MVFGHATDPQSLPLACVLLSPSGTRRYHPFPPLSFFLLLMILGPHFPLTVTVSFGDGFVPAAFWGQRRLGWQQRLVPPSLCILTLLSTGAGPLFPPFPPGTSHDRLAVRGERPDIPPGPLWSGRQRAQDGFPRLPPFPPPFGVLAGKSTRSPDLHHPWGRPFTLRRLAPAQIFAQGTVSILKFRYFPAIRSFMPPLSPRKTRRKLKQRDI